MENILVIAAIVRLKIKSCYFDMLLVMMKRSPLSALNVVKNLQKLDFCGITGNDILRLEHSNVDIVRNDFILPTR